MSKKEKDFCFYVPVELIKAKNQDEEAPDDWKVQGIASTADEDLQQEIVDQNGLDISVLKAGRGLFNCDHQKGPENVVGEIEDAEFIDYEGSKCLFVKGYLFKKQPRAQAFYNIMSSLKKGAKPRVHMSIEGKILNRDLVDSKTIRKARVEKVALTLDPVNPYTYADLAKSLKEEDEIETSTELTVSKPETLELTLDQASQFLEVIKALAAGAGYGKAPEARTGGEAMSRESLDYKLKKINKKYRKNVIKSFLTGIVEKFPKEDPVKLMDAVINILDSKLK